MSSSNSNVLEGMRCPKCGSCEPFRIEVMTTATVFDDGVEETENHEWENTSCCGCIECCHQGSVADFTIGDDQ
jgi:hypothetical protein